LIKNNLKLLMLVCAFFRQGLKISEMEKRNNQKMPKEGSIGCHVDCTLESDYVR